MPRQNAQIGVSSSYTEHILEAPDNELVCYCSQVTKADIQVAIANGASSLEEIKAATGACSRGRCKELSPRRR